MNDLQLTREQKQRVTLWLRTFFVAALCAVAFGWGQYGVAPGGGYAFYDVEVKSFDPATYRWFFQSVLGLESMIVMGTFIGMFYALITTPIAALIATLLRYTPRMGRLAYAWVNLDKRWIVPLLCVFWLAGLGVTIHYGLNPGVCC